MTTALDIMGRASLALQDPEYVRWTRKEMLEWISEAQVAIARTPGAYSKVEVIELKEGTKQDLPDDAWALESITRNVDEDGTYLSPVRLVTRSLLDSALPSWHMVAEKPLVENYVYDERTPKVFYVFPPNDGTGHIECIYMGIPAKVTEETQELELDETFVPALVSYVLYRATSKESDYASGLQSAATFFQNYMSELAQGLESRGRASPNGAFSTGPVAENGGTE